MLRISVVDSSAESRNSLLQQIDRYVNSDVQDIALMPRVSLKPLTFEELKFHGNPDICVLGDEFIERDFAVISKIKKIIPHSVLIVKLKIGSDTLSRVEMLASLGVDDTFTDQTTAIDFLKKIILLARKRSAEKRGILVLIEGAKGGVGVTSVTAGLGEELALKGKRVALIDLDFETQDLSRFMQTRPFVNENLQLILSGMRPVTEELVKQCLIPVWQDEDGLFVMPPSPECEDLYSPRTTFSRSLLSILEVLDENLDVILVDMGSCTGSIRQTLYRAADKVVYLINNDPASLYASAAKLNKMRGMLSPTAQILVVENGSTKNGLSRELLEREFGLAVRLESNEWCLSRIPFSRSGLRWPGSGDTIASLGTDSTAVSLRAILKNLKLVEETSYAHSKTSIKYSSLRSFFVRVLKSQGKVISEAIPKPKPIELPTNSQTVESVNLESVERKLIPFKNAQRESQKQVEPVNQEIEEEFFVRAKVG